MAATPPLDRFGHKLDAEGWAFVQQWTSWARKFAYRFRGEDVASGDMLADIAVDALVEAIATHKPARGTIKTWANNLVRWRVTEAAGGERGRTRFRWEANHLSDDEFPLDRVFSLDPEPREELIDRLFDDVPPRDATILRERFLHGDKLTVIASRHRMSKQNVSRIVREWRPIFQRRLAALDPTAA